jgi:rare lipoprotein A (peptidoglycan hydrolase)
MKAGRDRHGRKDQSRRGRTAFGRSSRRARSAAVAALLASLTLGATSVQAGTGGVGAVSTSGEGTASTGQDLAFSTMRSAGATWYGPGLYGNHTACGETLRPTTIGVAHRTLPCGTTVKLSYHGHVLVTKVIDRGPYTRGNSFDLTNGARLALEFSGANQVRYAVALQYARH